jgi:small GTP-binding protein
MKGLSWLIKKIKKSKHIIRMTIVGDGAVGKTTLVNSLLEISNLQRKENNYNKNVDKEIRRTPFMEIESWNVDDLVIQCYDLTGQRTPGSHPVDIIREQVLKSIDIYLFVFSLYRYESFENINSWMELLFDSSEEKDDVRCILVGNKLDLERNVSKDLIDSVVENEDCFQSYIETSATESIGIDELLKEIMLLGKNILDLKN